MLRLQVTTRSGSERQVEVAGGQSLMEALREQGFDDILAICGGCCSCATCHVHVAPEDFVRLAPMGADENDLLDSSEHRVATSRLSCQIPLTEELRSLRVRIAPAD